MKTLKDFLCIILWFTFSPLFFVLSVHWKLLKKKAAFIATLLSPFGVIFIISAIIMITESYNDYKRKYSFTSSETLYEITGVMFPQNKLVDYWKERRGFTGDFMDYKTIRLENLPASFYQQLDSICQNGRYWSKDSTDSEIKYSYGRTWGNGLPAPKGQNENDDLFLNISIIKGDSLAKISTGAW